MWGLILSRSLFVVGGGLISRIPTQQGLGLSLVGELVSNAPNNLGLEHSHGTMSWTITLWVTLIYFSEDGERLEAIDCFF